MDVTLVPGGDVELPEGAPLGACREALARLTGAPELVDAVLSVDGRVLGDEHVTGVRPLVHGAVLRVGAGRPDPAASAASAAWHVAVLSGPGAGAVAVPGRGGVVRVGRADKLGASALPDPAGLLALPDPAGLLALPDPAGLLALPDPAGLLALPDPAGLLALPDPAVSRRHAVVVGPRPGGRRWRVRDLGSANGTTVGTRAGVRPVRALGRRVAPGRPLRVGGSVLVVREGGVGARRTGGSARDAADRHPRPASPAAWAGPLLVSAGLAAVTGSPVLLALGLAGPLAAAAPALTARLRRRRPVPLRLGPDAAAAAVAAADGRAPASDPPAPPAAGVGTSTGTGTGASTGTPGGAPPWWEWAADGLAVVGPGRAAAARALVAARAAEPGAVSVLGRGAGAWAWLGWPAGASGGRLRVRHDGTTAACEPDRRHLVVVLDGGAAADRWWAGRRPHLDGALVLAAGPDAAPAWCRWVLAVHEDGTGALHGPGGPRPVVVPTGSPLWAGAQARRLAAAWCSGTHDAVGTPGGVAAPEPPPRVALADLLGDVGPVAVASRWARATREPHAVRSLAVPLAATDRVVSVDLLADGPHALVAGTTGSGKSELLQAWLLGLALHHPSTDLAVVLVDYKGGASFGPCARLPHVVGLVTDLDAETAGRALAGLRAEQRRRKRLLAEAGVTDLEDLRERGPAPPRLVVVVDEFRAMAADLPEFVPGLVDLVAQGRSLGLHLVLATQRPAGAVTAQMRANLGLRVCLRVTDAADSLDVVEVPDAAALPVGAPGRAVVRRGGSTTVVQTAWAALPRGVWDPPTRPGRPVTVRWSRAWATAGDPTGTRPHVPGAATPGDQATVLTDAVREAHGLLDLPAPAALWSPPLPALVHEGALRATVDRAAAGAYATGAARVAAARATDGRDGGAGVGDGDTAGLLLGLTDRTDAPVHGALRWSSGALLVAGRPRSGRTTALRTAARAALERGWHVHVVGEARHGLAPHPGLGTTVGHEDPALVARLMHRLLDGGAAHGSTRDGGWTLLVLDDAGAVQRALERLPRAAGAELVERVLREAGRRRVRVAVAGAATDLARLAQHCAERLVLATEPHDDVLLGVPSALTGGRALPGRGVHLAAGRAVRCHVALPDPGPPAPALPPRAATESCAGEPVRLRPVPDHVTALPPPAQAVATGPWWLPVGLGGDDAGPVHLDLSRGGLVVGPPGSGRTTALAALATAAVARGLMVVPHPAPDGATGVLGEVRRLVSVSGAAPVLVLVDDADALPLELDDALAALATGHDGGGDARVVVAARTDRAAGAYRGVVAALRASATLVLAPLTPGSGDVAGTDLALVCDPDRPRAPGRGAVVHRGSAVPVQVVDARRRA